MSADADVPEQFDGPPKTWVIETETSGDGEQHLGSVEGEHGDVAAVFYVRDDADLGHLRGVLRDLESEIQHLVRDPGGDGS